ncbi:hypothetical protein H0H93_012147 [Arthromyces matolae]|nr:hypothetical protein H0H93_012147 [Arthromyces matolae]
MPTPDLHIPTKSNQPAQSLTMQMALRPEGLNVRPVSEPVYQMHGKDPSSEPVYTPAIPLPETSDTVSSRPVRKRATSQPASSQAQSSNSGRQQCAGITKAGKQCTRQVKLQSQHMKNDTYDSEVFCFQHLKEVMGPSGFYSRKDGAWIKFAGESGSLMSSSRSLRMIRLDSMLPSGRNTSRIASRNGESSFFI